MGAMADATGILRGALGLGGCWCWWVGDLAVGPNRALGRMRLLCARYCRLRGRGSRCAGGG